MILHCPFIDIMAIKEEIVISDVNFDNEGDWVLRNSWRPADGQDTHILDQIIETVEDKVIRCISPAPDKGKFRPSALRFLLITLS